MGGCSVSAQQPLDVNSSIELAQYELIERSYSGFEMVSLAQMERASKQ